MTILLFGCLFIIVSYFAFRAQQKKYEEKYKILNTLQDQKLEQKQNILQDEIKVIEKNIQDNNRITEHKTPTEIEDFWSKK